MSVAAGQQLSHYNLVDKIGEAGFGAVWRARDAGSGDTVAVRVLPAGVAADETSQARCLQEAGQAASAAGERVVPVHEMGEEGGNGFLVMDLVEGSSPRKLTSAGPMPPAEIADLGAQAAETLARTHRRGLVHRSLRPDSLLVTPDGRVRVSGFGLAALFQAAQRAAGSEAPTRSLDASTLVEPGPAGALLCPSPEQARGKEPDARSDIFALGSVLYEMTTGQAPFADGEGGEAIREIARGRPVPVHDRLPSVPLELDRIIAKAMEPKREDRYQTMDDLAVDLRRLEKELAAGSSPSYDSVAIPVAPERPGRRLPRWALPAAAALLALGALVAWQTLRAPAEPAAGAPAAVKLTQLTSLPGMELFPALSPDGKRLAYTAPVGPVSDIFLQRVGGGKAINLTESATTIDGQPAFSPDGERIAFVRMTRQGSGIWVMGATGESPKQLTDSGFDPTWSPDGSQIAFATGTILVHTMGVSGSTLWVVDVDTGEKRQIYDGHAMQPDWSPHGHRIAFWASTDQAAGSNRRVWTVAPDGSDPVPVTDGTAEEIGPVWSRGGDRLYFSSDRGGSMNLWEVPIDEATGEVLGEPRSLTSATLGRRYHLERAFASDRLVFDELIQRWNAERVEFDPVAGEVVGRPIPITEGSVRTAAAGSSPDNEWVALVRQEQGAAPRRIFVARPDGSDMRPLIQEDTYNNIPVWSPDGSRILFEGNLAAGRGLWMSSPEGTDLRRVVEGIRWGFPVWSPDGGRIALNENDGNAVAILDLARPTGENLELLPPPVEGTDGAGFVMASTWSPDGRWLAGPAGDNGLFAYSLETGEYRKIVDRMVKWAQFLSDSRRLLCMRGETLHVVDMETGESRPVFEMEPPGDMMWFFSLSHDKRWIYYVRQEEEVDVWMAELG